MYKVDRNELNFLFIDTELALSLYYAYYSKKPQFLRASQIKARKFMPCAAWQWRHLTAPESACTLDNDKAFRKNYKNDYHVAKKLFQAMEQADVIIGHNLDGFDMKEINRAFILHGLGVLPEIKTIDTLKIARKYFAFEGNSLRDLAALFELKNKFEQPDWQAVAEGCPKATRYAEKYCKQDVKVLIAVFQRLAPFIRRFPAVKENVRPTACFCCGSKRLKNHGTRFDGAKFYVDIRCQECHHPHKVSVKAAKK